MTTSNQITTPHSVQWVKSEKRLKKVAITGQSGFMGTHLFNYLNHVTKDFELIPFAGDVFEDKSALENICRNADTIVHLAALNRHNDPDEIYRVNIDLVRKVIDACEAAGSKPHIIFASSTQESRDNAYGRSKREGRRLFEEWAERNGSRFTAMVIPNVFGPFGVPYHNSVISTFSHQLTHDEQPHLEIDADLNLIYINDLIDEIHGILAKGRKTPDGRVTTIYEVPARWKYKVSDILSMLERFKADYFDNGLLPKLHNDFEVDLFNTFTCYIPETRFPVGLSKHSDQRGSFFELMKTYFDGQSSYSTTRPGYTRGNHFHLRKIERFIVVKGTARIEIRKIGTDRVVSYLVDGDNPSFVDMPVWHAHNITNIGNDDLITLFWTNEHYDPDDADTYFEKV